MTATQPTASPSLPASRQPSAAHRQIARNIQETACTAISEVAQAAEQAGTVAESMFSSAQSLGSETKRLETAGKREGRRDRHRQ